MLYTYCTTCLDSKYILHIPTTCCESALLWPEYIVALITFCIQQKFQKPCTEINRFHAILFNVLLKTKFTIVIYLPYYQSPVYIRLLEIIEAIYLEILFGCIHVYLKAQYFHIYVQCMYLHSLVKVRLQFYELKKGDPMFASNDMKLRNFQYRYLKQIKPTNKRWFRLKDLSINEMVGLFVAPTRVYLLDFFCFCIRFYLLLSPYLRFIALLYLDLYALGDDAL